MHGVCIISLSVDRLCRFMKLKVNYYETCRISDAKLTFTVLVDGFSLALSLKL